MKVFILVDNDNIVRCMASEECNLHKDKLHMSRYFVECGGTVGDEYKPGTDTWIPHPENYPQPSEEEIKERKIQEEMKSLLREQSIQNLIDRGELPTDYEQKRIG